MLRALALAVLFGIHLAAALVYRVVVTFNRELPSDLSQLRVYRPERATIVYSADGEKIAELYVQKRVVVPLARVPKHVQDAFIAAEDSRFYSHIGFDPIGITRAAWANWRNSGIHQGASTITQQVARMLMLTNKRSYERKIKEVILAVRIEQELPKSKVLEIYLNQVYLGHGAYGVQAAAETYFAKDVEQLTLAEAAILAGLPKAPSEDSPFTRPDRARIRQLYVLGRMRELGLITAEQARDARAEPIATISQEQPLAQVSAPYFVEKVRRMLVAEYGGKGVLEGGLRVYTTVEMPAQRAAESAVRAGLEALDRRLGFRGPVGHLDAEALQRFVTGPGQRLLAPAGATTPVLMTPVESAISADDTVVAAVTELAVPKKVVLHVGTMEVKLDPTDLAHALAWKAAKNVRLAIGDLMTVRVHTDDKLGSIATIAQTPEVQAALLAIDPHTGAVKALVGGYDYAESQFDRATQAHRQAGSSIKPLIYAAAIDSNAFTQLSVIVDRPVRIPTASGIWAPENYKHEYLGPMTLRTAIAKSINTISVQLVAALGVDDVIKMFKRLGLGRPEDPLIPRHPSIAVGTPDVSLLEMTGAYATFPSGGLRVEPRFVTRIATDDGELPLPEKWARVPSEQILSAETAYTMVDLMQGVVERGTATKAQALGRPVGGKTGTSTQYRDAWFIGYSTDLLAGVWVGRDNFKPIGPEATGGTTALPIWLRFMQVAHPATEPRNFPIPQGIILARANELTGEPAAPGTPNARWVAFKRGTLPSAFGGHGDASFAADPFATAPGASPPEGPR